MKYENKNLSAPFSLSLSHVKFRYIHMKTLVLKSLFNKVAGLHVNIAKLLKTSISKNICERLLLAKRESID